MHLIFNLINLAVVEIRYGCTGMSRREIKLKKISLFSIFKYWVGRVGKTKNKKIWPKHA